MSEEGIATWSTNKFNDVLVTSNGSTSLPKDLVLDETTKCIALGYAECPEGMQFLVETTQYGMLFATPAACDNFPGTINIRGKTHIAGGCGVVFVEQNGAMFVVLVQVKGREYIMNPAGGTDLGEYFAEAATRETKEETGLDIVSQGYLAEWTFQQWFGGLKFPHTTKAIYGYAKCPEDWDLAPGQANRIEFEDDGDEVDYLVALDVEAIDEHCEELNLDGHHLAMIREAEKRLTAFPYLDSFHFI